MGLLLRRESREKGKEGKGKGKEGKGRGGRESEGMKCRVPLPTFK